MLNIFFEPLNSDDAKSEVKSHMQNMIQGNMKRTVNQTQCYYTHFFLLQNESNKFLLKKKTNKHFGGIYYPSPLSLCRFSVK